MTEKTVSFRTGSPSRRWAPSKRRWKRIAVLLQETLSLVFFFCISACGAAYYGTAIAVFDGDTARVLLDDGRQETVRYLLIDTPELHHPRRRQEEFGQEATEANRALVEGHRVRLTTDVEPRDRYGRLLARVAVETPEGWKDVGTELIRRGLALPMIIPPNGAGRDDIDKALEIARQTQAGWWHRARRRVFTAPQAWAELPTVGGSFLILIFRCNTVTPGKTRWVLQETDAHIIVTLPKDFPQDPTQFRGHTLQVWGKLVPSFNGGELAAASPVQIDIVDNVPDFPPLSPKITP